MSTHHPTSDRPEMPDGYGVPADSTGLLDWADVERRLVESPSTGWPPPGPTAVRTSCRAGGSGWTGRSGTTGRRRPATYANLAGNAACTLHLEDGTRAVIVEGTAGPTTPPGPQLGARLSAVFGKYHEQGYPPDPGSWEGESAGGLCRWVVPAVPRQGPRLVEFPERRHPLSLAVTGGGCRSSLTTW